MSRLITEEAVYEYLTSKFDEFDISIFGNEFAGNILDGLGDIPTAYDTEKVVEEIKKLDLDGVSMVEDGKYKLVRKNEVVSLIQTNGICNGRYNTCADCYKMNCPLSTEKTFTDKWSEQVRKGGVE